MKPQVLLRSLPEMYAASKPPFCAPAATAARIEPPNAAGTDGVPASRTKRTAPLGPSARLDSEASLAAKAAACGPIVAESVKLRNGMSRACDERDRKRTTQTTDAQNHDRSFMSRT